MDIQGEYNTQPVRPVVMRQIIPNVPNMFSVPLSAYAYQPWSTRATNTSQWFNYNLNPTTWAQYCQFQTMKPK
jgi:hypothetical protein